MGCEPGRRRAQCRHQQMLQPSIITYTATISACEAGSAWQHALELLQEAHGKCQVNLIGYNAAIGACARAAHWAEALQLWREVGTSGNTRVLLPLLLATSTGTVIL